MAATESEQSSWGIRRMVRGIGSLIKAQIVGTSTGEDVEVEAVDLLVCDSFDLLDGEMREVSLGEGRGKALLSKVNGTHYATSHLCPHAKAPLAKGTLSKDGRIVCPWHGACFSATTGDIEESPSIDALHSFPVKEANGKVYVEVSNWEHVKQGRRTPKCVKRKGGAKDTVVIVGGGGAGFTAAETLRHEGFNGKIVLLTSEPHLPIDRPKLSKSMKTTAAKIALRDAVHHETMEIDVRLSTRVTRINTKAKSVEYVTTDNESPAPLALSYSFLILASGTVPRELKGSTGFKNVYTLRTVFDSNAIEDAVQLARERAILQDANAKPNLVIVGTGFIGMEAAAAFSKTCNVTVIGSTPFKRTLGEQVGLGMAKLHESNGVSMKLNIGIQTLEADARDGSLVGHVVLNDGQRIAVDVLVAGLGSIPATDYLADSGITVDSDGGVSVDSSTRVSGQDSVFAVGDIARYPYHITGENVRIEHWAVAQNQGRTAAQNIMRIISAYDPSSAPLMPHTAIPFFWTVQYGKSLRFAGHAKNVDEIYVDGSLDIRDLSFVAYYAHDGKILAIASMGRDPIVAHGAELMRLGRMPELDAVKKGLDILSLSL
ncbi:Apoptosis-inducing factor 3 [Chytriomyces hyalinus]|nr:Apoptosis-inducing factor 3 [Chytriomyces hyalinus]